MKNKNENASSAEDKESKTSSVEVGDEKVVETTFAFTQYNIAIKAKSREEAEEKLKEILNKK
jgi:predicted SpoU family rRNA methylase